MNYLVVTHFFEEDGVIGAVRWTNFAYRLAKEDKVFVVTHNKDGFSHRVTKNDIEVITIDNECWYRKRGVRNASIDSGELKRGCSVQKKRNPLKEIIKSFLYHFSMKETSRKNAKLIYGELKKSNVKIDYIFSTSRPFIDGYLGWFLAKKPKQNGCLIKGICHITMALAI